MPSSKLLKERIESIQDTMKITNAMYLISSSKLRKARKNYQNVSPYFNRMRDTISRVVPHLPEEPVHPFFHDRTPGTVPAPGHGRGLGRQFVGGGIPRATPPGLASRVHGLPPILYATDRRPMPSCSKGSRGLSVLLRVSRIFTTSAISPGPWLRQRPSRYAFRAGRNLPDKEFRYLRTVIVTAAVYRGLDSPLRRS